MERQEVEVFLTLCEELHFGRTAARLRLSAARVSQLIQKVERRVGAPLFDRTSRSVTLTELGRQFRDDLAPAHESVQAAVRRAVAAGTGVTGTLRIGFFGTLTGRRMSALCDRFTERHPGTAANVVLETELGDHLRPLREDRVDILVTLLPVRGPEFVTGPVVVREPMLMAIPVNHPLAGRDRTSLEDLGDHPVVASSYDRERDDPFEPPFTSPFTPTGRPVDIAYRVETIQAGMALVAAGKGIGTLLAQLAMFNQYPEIAYRPLENSPICEIGLVWSSARETALIRSFARVVAEHDPTEVNWDPLGDDGLRLPQAPSSP